MSPEPILVLVLYRNALLGEGLGRLIGADLGVQVRAVQMSEPGAVARALAECPEVVVLEEGGALAAGEVLDRSLCSLLLSVSIGSSRAWRISRAPISPDPARLAQEITAAARSGLACDVAATEAGSRAGKAAAAVTRALTRVAVPSAG